MPSRTAGAVSALPLLAACGSGAQPAAERARTAPDHPVLCATGGAAAFAPRCDIEQTAGAGGTVLTILNPDGGFHRLIVTGDGRGVATADGAVDARVSLAGADSIEVAIGPDRYRLPATVRTGAGR